MIEPLEVKRQAFHLILGLILVALLYFDILNAVLLAFFFCIGIIFSILSKYKKIKVIDWLLENLDRKEAVLPGKGVLFYLLGSIIVLVLFDKNIALASIMVLVLGDSLCHIGVFGRIKVPWNDKKTFEGIIIGMIAGILGAIFFVKPLEATLASVIAMSFESINWDRYGLDDNLIVPIVAGSVIWFLRFI